MPETVMEADMDLSSASRELLRAAILIRSRDSTPGPHV